MNLGQVLGEQQLRIWELEEQLATGRVPERRGRIEDALAEPGRQKGIVAAIRDVIASASAPISIDELALQLPQYRRARISQNVQVMASTGKFRRIGSGRGARYTVP